MSLSDLWMMMSANPSPVPSFSSTTSSEEIDVVKPDDNFLLQVLYNQQLLQQLLPFYQLQNGLNQCLPQAPKPILTSPKRSKPYEVPAGRRVKQRKLEDTVTNSPVSGMFIKADFDVVPNQETDLDETAAYVEVTEESRSKIEEIENVIGDCICQLCKVKYDDVFRLAQHRCPRIAHEEYRCPECDKVFSCPANLASHRRWHKPRDLTKSPTTYSCDKCCTQNIQSKKQLKIHQQTCRSLNPILTSMLMA